MSIQAVWHKQPHETPAQYTAFQCYLTLHGKRTIRAAFEAYRHTDKGVKTAPKQGKGKRVSGYFAKWAVEYQWQERAIAYDNYLNGEHDRQAQASVSEYMTARRNLYREASESIIKAILARIQEADTPIKDLRELLELLDSEFLSSQKTRFEIEALRDLRSAIEGNPDASEIATLYLGKR